MMTQPINEIAVYPVYEKNKRHPSESPLNYAMRRGEVGMDEDYLVEQIAKRKVNVEQELGDAALRMELRTLLGQIK